MTVPDRFFEDPKLARLYDAICDTAGRDDFDFYLPYIMAAVDVVDIGCGTGTLLREARTAGHTGRLTGIDPATGMMESACRTPGIEWVCGYFGAQGWDGNFDLAVMTGHAFQVLVETETIEEFLRDVHRALRPAGRFAFETRNPGAKEWESWTGGRTKQVTVDDTLYEDRRTVIRPFDGETVTFTHTFTSPDWASAEVSTSTLRFLSCETLNAVLARAGFAIDAQYGEWDRSSVTAHSPEIITIARKA